jgi:hypothetical protein
MGQRDQRELSSRSEHVPERIPDLDPSGNESPRALDRGTVLIKCAKLLTIRKREPFRDHCINSLTQNTHPSAEADYLLPSRPPAHTARQGPVSSIELPRFFWRTSSEISRLSLGPRVPSLSRSVRCRSRSGPGPRARRPPGRTSDTAGTGAPTGRRRRVAPHRNAASARSSGVAGREITDRHLSAAR